MIFSLLLRISDICHLLRPYSADKLVPFSSLSNRKIIACLSFTERMDRLRYKDMMIMNKHLWRTWNEPIEGNSKPIRTHSKVVHKLRRVRALLYCAFWKRNKLAFTSLFNAVVLKRIWRRILIMTNEYSWQNWNKRKSLDNREIQIIEVWINEVRLYWGQQQYWTSLWMMSLH